jgi:hypothetical protein
MKKGSRALAKLERRVKKDLVEALIASAVAKGEIDPTGKSEDQLLEELLPVFQNVIAGNVESIIDFRSTLLAHARRFRKADEEEVSILFYATWFEHWINALFDNRAGKAGFSKTDIQLCIRQTGLKAKFGCFPLVLKLPRLAARHISAMLKCAELRNAFVHYKFTARPLDDVQYGKQLKQALEGAEKAVRYLAAYERHHVFRRAKRQIKRLARG